MTINKITLGWLTTVPASDENFKGQLKYANPETIRAALKSKGLNKTTIKALKAELIRRAKANEK